MKANEIDKLTTVLCAVPNIKKNFFPAWENYKMLLFPFCTKELHYLDFSVRII